MKSYRERVLKPWLVLPGIWQVFGLGKEEQRVKSFFTNTMKAVRSPQKTTLKIKKKFRNFQYHVILFWKSSGDRRKGQNHRIKRL
jgi:hypothetical protein